MRSIHEIVQRGLVCFTPCPRDILIRVSFLKIRYPAAQVFHFNTQSQRVLLQAHIVIFR